jgi:hypothetical protein
MKHYLPLLFQLTLGASAAPSLPTITAQPQSQSVSLGSNASLTVGTGGATAFQWRFGGTNLPGATASTLQITNAQFTDSGYYLLVAKNEAGANSWE